MNKTGEQVDNRETKEMSIAWFNQTLYGHIVPEKVREICEVFPKEQIAREQNATTKADPS